MISSNDENEQTSLIKLISSKCKTRYGELLIECMEYNNVCCTMELTIGGMKDYCRSKGIEIKLGGV